MKNLKSFIFSEKKMAGVIFGVLAVAVFSFVFGPNIYAQFARQTGTAGGFGYGYGYGYGLGYGFDAGATAGYRIDGNDLTTYDYGYGYGYLDTGVTYDSTNGYSITPDNLVNLVQSGIVVPNGGDITSTTVITFQDKVTLTVASGITVVIPSGTTFTAATAGDFSALVASNSVTTSDLTSVTVQGALQFGLPSLGLTVSPAITISIAVDSSYNGRGLVVYRKDATGSWVNGTGGTDGVCAVTGGICSFTTTHLSSFAVGAVTSTPGGGVGGTSGGGGTYTPPPTSDPTVAGVYSKESAMANNPTIAVDKSLATVTSANCTAGSLIKSASLSAVYYCGSDGKRYVFVNDKVYFTWYADFSGVQVISDTLLASIVIGGNVTYRPGVKMIKIQSDPKVYAVARGGVLRWVQTEAVATRLYGAAWNTMIDDVSDAFFVNYTMGTTIGQ